MSEAFKYFSGASGVYYDRKNHEFLVLEHSGEQMYNIKECKALGSVYYYWSNENRYRKKKGVFTGMDHMEYLGDL